MGPDQLRGGIVAEELRKVRTTMEPEKEIEVTPQEFIDLSRQGLIYNPEPTKPSGRRASEEK